MDYYKFYELYTEHGTLYVYEKYVGDKGAYPETREFFTNDVAQRGYDQLCFNNGRSIFKTRKRQSNGYVKEEYMKELEPYEFLERIEGFISNEEERQKMVQRTYNIFKSIFERHTGRIIVPPNPVFVEEKNNIAIQSLKKYIK